MLWKGAYLIYVLALMLDDTTLNLPSTQAPFELSKKEPDIEAKQLPSTQGPFELSKRARHGGKTITLRTILSVES